MKLFYIFLNIFLFIVAVLLLVLNLTFTPHVQDKILSMAPDLKKTAFAPLKIKDDREAIPGVAALWENNLFSPYRSGDGGPLLGGARPVGMELLGVSRLGDIAGAIIIDKTPSTAPAAPPVRIRGGRGGAPVAAAPQSTAPKFWKLGDQLQNGFFLSEVNNDSVVLSRGREQIVLKLDYSSQESLSRNASAAEAAAAASAKMEVKPPVAVAPASPPVPGQPVVAPGRTGRQPPVPPGAQPQGGQQQPQQQQQDQQQDQDSASPAVVRPE